MKDYLVGCMKDYLVGSMDENGVDGIMDLGGFTKGFHSWLRTYGLNIEVWIWSSYLPSLKGLVERLLLFPLRALTNREQREQRKQKTPLLSVVVYCGYDAVSKGSVYCACVKSKQKDAFGCEERFSKNFSFFLLPFLW